MPGVLYIFYTPSLAVVAMVFIYVRRLLCHVVIVMVSVSRVFCIDVRNVLLTIRPNYYDYYYRIYL